MSGLATDHPSKRERGCNPLSINCHLLRVASLKTMAATKKLNNVTWVLGDKPCKTLKMAAGCWTDDNRITANKGGKVGKQHSKLVRFF